MRYLIQSLFIIFLFQYQAFAQGNRNWDFHRVLSTIGVKEAMTIGEAGAGAGFFTFHLSRAVGQEGTIYANDISNYALGRLKSRMVREGVTNIVSVLGEETDPKFPVDNLEMIVIVHAFHDFDEPAQWLQNTRKYVNPGAALVIIEKDPDRWGQGWHHFMSRKTLLDLLTKAGFPDIKVHDFMPEDNIYMTHF